jgi:putative holliday junction resolvase
MMYLGIDWGKRKIGLAIGGQEIKIASPLSILFVKEYRQTIEDIKEIITSEGIDKVVIGDPVSLGGDESLNKQFKSFVKEISELGLDVVLEDERFSSKLAQKQQLEVGKKQEDDALAAAAILQTHFDKM